MLSDSELKRGIRAGESVQTGWRSNGSVKIEAAVYAREGRLTFTASVRTAGGEDENQEKVQSKNLTERLLPLLLLFVLLLHLAIPLQLIRCSNI